MTGISAIERAQRLKSTLSAAPRKLLIDGKEIPAASGETFEVLNPATGKILARVARGGAADVEETHEILSAESG